MKVRYSRKHFMLWLGMVIALTIGFFGGWRYGRTPGTSAQATAVANLQALNALLRTLTASPDIIRSLSELGRRVQAIVPCDRVGLALLSEDGQGYTTYTACIDATGPPSEPAPDLHFPRSGTIVDEVVRARQGRIAGDISQLAREYLDANVLNTARYGSAALMPIVFEGDAIGALSLVSRRRSAFSRADLETLAPVAEALAAAHGTRRLAHALARHQMAHEFSDLTFTFANDMSGAVQALIGRCELLAREAHDPAAEASVGGMLQQARRLRDILNQMQRMTRDKAGSAPRGA